MVPKATRERESEQGWREIPPRQANPEESISAGPPPSHPLLLRPHRTRAGPTLLFPLPLLFGTPALLGLLTLPFPFGPLLCSTAGFRGAQSVLCLSLLSLYSLSVLLHCEEIVTRVYGGLLPLLSPLSSPSLALFTGGSPPWFFPGPSWVSSSRRDTASREEQEEEASPRLPLRSNKDGSGRRRERGGGGEGAGGGRLPRRPEGRRAAAPEPQQGRRRAVPRSAPVPALPPASPPISSVLSLFSAAVWFLSASLRSCRQARGRRLTGLDKINQQQPCNPAIFDPCAVAVLAAMFMLHPSIVADDASRKEMGFSIRCLLPFLQPAAV